MIDKDYDDKFVPIYEKFTTFEKKLSKLEKIRYIKHPKQFFKESAYFKEIVGKESHYSHFSNIKVNKFNLGSDYLTHGFDFYRGSFHGQMIRGLINFCNLENNSTILDPFCGSGTTLIEAKLLGLNSIGIDINPIACLNSKIKTELLDYPINSLLKNNDKYMDLSYYHKYFRFKGNFNNFLKINFNELFYLFLYTQEIVLEYRFSVNRMKAFTKIFHQIINTLKEFENLQQRININFGERSKIIFGNNILKLKEIKSNSLDAIITSPPYLDLIDYIQEDIFKIQHLFNINQIKELKFRSIGNKTVKKDLRDKLYWNKMNFILRDLYRILKRGKMCIIIIGNYRNMKENFKSLIIKNNFNIEELFTRKVVNIKRKNNNEYVFFLKK